MGHFGGRIKGIKSILCSSVSYYFMERQRGCLYPIFPQRSDWRKDMGREGVKRSLMPFGISQTWKFKLGCKSPQLLLCSYNPFNSMFRIPSFPIGLCSVSTDVTGSLINQVMCSDFQWTRKEYPLPHTYTFANTHIYTHPHIPTLIKIPVHTHVNITSGTNIYIWSHIYTYSQLH